MCCKDLWYLEVDKPAAPGRVALVKAGTHSLEVNWQGSPSTHTYILQVQLVGQLDSVHDIKCLFLDSEI